MAALEGLKILVPESRELDLFTAMLEAEGASTLRCPMVQILALDDTAQAEAWIASLIESPFDDLILLTGDGLRKLLDLSGVHREELIGALKKTRIITRGPKPARALREIGLVPSLAAPSPTSEGVLRALEGENLAGRRIGVQLYPGDGAIHLVEALRGRGAQVFAVTPYRYASETENGKVAQAIRAMAAGEIGMIAFTASPQIERLMTVARDAGLEKVLADGFARTPIAAIGPVVEETLRRFGVTSAVRPQASFHLKPLIRAIIAWRQA
jgi:uroporphyrinogen-III synthase